MQHRFSAMSNVKAYFLVVAFLGVWMALASCRSTPVQHDDHALHPIDFCIFTCDTCFKSEALVACANSCISSGGYMEDGIWRRLCPGFQRGISPDMI